MKPEDRDLLAMKGLIADLPQQERVDVNRIDAPHAKLSAVEQTELLDWVSACQSAYHIESTPDHRFGGLPSNLSENRAGLVEYVETLMQERLLAERAFNDANTVQVYGKKSGELVLLGTAPVSPRMKARELAREQFGHFEDGDGSEAELCFAALEQLIDYIEGTA